MRPILKIVDLTFTNYNFCGTYHVVQKLGLIVYFF